MSDGHFASLKDLLLMQTRGPKKYLAEHHRIVGASSLLYSLLRWGRYHVNQSYFILRGIERLVFKHDLGQCLDNRLQGSLQVMAKSMAVLERDLSTYHIPQISSLAAPADRYVLHRRWARKVDEEEG